MPRKSEYSQDWDDKICQHIAQGGSLKSFCAVPRHPSMPTVQKWLEGQRAFLNRYVRAREDSADAHAEQIIELTRKLEEETSLTDYCERILAALGDYEGEDRKEIMVLVVDLAKRAKAITQARVTALYNAIRSLQWVASKLKHTSYGDKLEVTEKHDFGDLTDAQLLARMQSLLVGGGMSRDQARLFALKQMGKSEEDQGVTH